MDNQNLISKSNLVMGFRQVMRGLENENIRCVVVDCDIVEKMYNQIVKACRVNGIDCKTGKSRNDIGAILGLEVPCGVFAELLVEQKR